MQNSTDGNLSGGGDSNAGPPALAQSLRELGKMVGRSASTVRKWISRDDWPRAWREPPWAASEVRQWMVIHLRADRAPGHHAAGRAGIDRPRTALEEARLRRELAAAARAELEQKQAEGRVHEVDSCQRRRLRQIRVVKHALLRLPRELSADLPEPYRAQVRRDADRRVRAILDEFAGQVEGAQ